MKITNLTDERQEIKLREIFGDNYEYSIYLEPHGSTEIEKVTILNHRESILSINDEQPAVVPALVEEEVEVVLEEYDELEEGEVVLGEHDEVEDEIAPVEEKPQVDGPEFVCEVCGAEFASSRGLNAHKNKAHSE